MGNFKEWKEKYYPVEASNKVSDLEALKEALLKYEGTRPEVLEEYGLEKYGYRIYEKGEEKGLGGPYYIPSWVFALNGPTCSLCKKHIDPNRRYDTNEFWVKACGDCPLNTPTTNCNIRKSPWWFMCNKGKVDPMIEKLKELIEIEERKIGNS